MGASSNLVGHNLPPGRNRVKDLIYQNLMGEEPPTPLHKDAFCQFPFRWIYYYVSNKSTGKETDKVHLCAVVRLPKNAQVFRIHFQDLLGPLLEIFFSAFVSVLICISKISSSLLTAKARAQLGTVIKLG